MSHSTMQDIIVMQFACGMNYEPVYYSKEFYCSGIELARGHYKALYYLYQTPFKPSLN